MPAPLVPARLDFLEGTPYSEAFGDVYHSAAGGAAQAWHVFLAGNGLPARWRGRRCFTILETGFGLGTNFLATLQAWREDPARCERLHFVSVEKHPLRAADLAPELRARWPMLVCGDHRLEFEDGRVVLTLGFFDVKRLHELRLAADAIYLDGFAPPKNPEMWSPQVMKAIARLAAPGATAATWSVASSVRLGLERAGFDVEKRPGFGEKKEMLCATFSGKGIEPVTPKTRQALVIGAGLAGAAACERLCARGWQVTLLERHARPAAEASGNHAGIFHPVVTPDDSIFARLTRAGFFSTLSHFKKFPGIRWDPCGVLQLSRDEKEADAQRRSVPGLPPEYAQVVTREEATRHAGVPVAAGGLWFPGAGWVQPASLVRAQLAACGKGLEEIYGVEVASVVHDQGVWILSDKAKKTIAQASTVVLATADDALHRVPHARLKRVRGQLTHLPADSLEAPRAVLLRGGFVVPAVDGVCVTGASYDLEDDDPLPREDSHAGNLERLQRMIPVEKRPAPLEGRVAFRSVVPDRLPIAGRLDEGLYAALAFGSRGLVWSALAAELVASMIEGEPLPLEGALADALDPGRFRRRAEARGLRS